MATDENSFEVLRSVRTHFDRVTPVLPDQLALTVGQYGFRAMRESKRLGMDGTPTLLHILHRKDVDLKTVDIAINPDLTHIIDTEFEPHYWFDMHSHLTGNGEFREALESMVFSYHEEVIATGSLSEGVTSGVFPVLTSHLTKHGKNSVNMFVFPSLNHSSDALFNAYSSLGLLLLDDPGPVILLDQSNLENFIGVNREGELLSSSDIVRYLVDMFLEKKGMIRDLEKLSKSFGVNLFSMLMASGASMEIYENLRNILDIALEQPLLDFDLSTASLVYVLVKAPSRLREQLPKGYIELEVNSWLRERANVDAPQICEPIYVDEYGDRVDVVILVGGFDTNGLFRTMEERISRFSTLIMEQELYDKGIWNSIRNRLLEISNGS